MTMTVAEQRTTTAAEAKAIPIRLVEPHPSIAMRFEYHVEPLAALIESEASEETPNGQLVPGRVVPRNDGKEGYWVYIGVKRYHALRLLYEKTGEEKFATYYAFVDSNTGDSLLRLFVRAKSENEEGKGEREGLSVMEEISGMRKIRDSVRPEELSGDLKRLYDLSGRLSEEKLAKLYEVERGSGFRLRLAHLEKLCAIEGEKEFYLAAASTAGFRFSEDKVEEAVKAKNAAYNLRWFNDVFPEYEKAPEARGAAEKKEEAGERELPPHEKGAFVVHCPSCGAGNLMQLRLEVEATLLPTDPGGEKFTATPDALVWFPSRCRHCAGEFFTFVEPQEGKKGYAVSGSLSGELLEPKDTVDLFDLGVSFGGEKNVWQKIMDGKVIGPLRLPRGNVKKKEG
jgi:hypothetical protein